MYKCICCVFFFLSMCYALVLVFAISTFRVSIIMVFPTIDEIIVLQYFSTFPFFPSVVCCDTRRNRGTIKKPSKRNLFYWNNFATGKQETKQFERRFKDENQRNKMRAPYKLNFY